MVRECGVCGAVLSFELRREGIEVGPSKEYSPERIMGETFGWGLENRVGAQRTKSECVGLP